MTKTCIHCDQLVGECMLDGKDCDHWVTRECRIGQYKTGVRDIPELSDLDSLLITGNYRTS